IKVCGNARTVGPWRDAIDIDASGFIGGAATLDDVADEIGAFVEDVSSGRLTAAERWGEGQIILPRAHPPL
ncbi:MAG: hydro-lyase, partial [Pseudomonadota bacterium]